MIALPALNEDIFLFVCVFGFIFFQRVGQSLEGRVLRNASNENIYIRCEMWLKKVTKTVGGTKGGRE